MRDDDISQAFAGELSFARADDRIDTLVSIHAGPDSGAITEFPIAEVDATSFEHVAEALERAERACAGAVGPSTVRLPLIAAGTREPLQHPLNWVSVTESKQSDEIRSCHELYVIVEGDDLVVTFVHGKFGYRREKHTRWSSAFARVAEVMSGTCSWHQFGDVASQNTMLGKGQFYWQDEMTRELIPIDNFVFRVENTIDIRLSGVSHRCALSLSLSADDDESSHEWYEDYAEGLLRLADLLEGKVDPTIFGKDPSPESYINAKGTRSAVLGEEPLAMRGRFFVESIYRSKDVWAAPVLVFQTAEGVQAGLRWAEAQWQVRVRVKDGALKLRNFNKDQATDALRVLAQVMNGSVLPQNF